METMEKWTELIQRYEAHLRDEERASNTIQKYIRDLRQFFSYLNGEALSKETILQWKVALPDTHTVRSINSMLAAVNGFLEWMGWGQMRVKPYRVQKAIFCQPEKELTREEYLRLVYTAEKRKNRRLSLLLQTICSTGIRVSELRFVTVQSLSAGRAQVNCKGKQRTIFLPPELCRALRRYCAERRLGSGPVFRTRSGRPMDRSNIWREMKLLCRWAGIPERKVFPHNLRHLFARAYYQMEKDLSRLADLLGHSSVETTRIYTIESGREHERQIARLGLLLPGA